jgi:hypothetical protein
MRGFLLLLEWHLREWRLHPAWDLLLEWVHRPAWHLLLGWLLLACIRLLEWVFLPAFLLEWRHPLGWVPRLPTTFLRRCILETTQDRMCYLRLRECFLLPRGCKEDLMVDFLAMRI